MINNKSEIINKLFFNELKELINKYNNIDTETITVIEQIYNDIQDKEIKEYILKNSIKLVEIVEEYKKSNKLDIDKIIFLIWYNLNIEDINISNISNYYNDLISENYIETSYFV